MQTKVELLRDVALRKLFQECALMREKGIFDCDEGVPTRVLCGSLQLTL